MRLFSVISGKSKIEFSVWSLNGKYQARINELVIYENTDYELVRDSLTDGMETNVFSYIGGMVH